MQALTTEDIQFIDRYLKNSDVIFTDIRVEMVDHVASEIEQRMTENEDDDFYETFKAYMVENKSHLQKSNKKFIEQADKKIFKILRKRVFSLKGLAYFFTIIFCFNLLDEFFDKTDVVMVLKRAPFSVMLLVGLVYFALVRIKKERYSSLERIGLYFICVTQIINMMSSSNFVQSYSNGEMLWAKMGTGFVVFLLIQLLLITLQFKKEYQQKFQFLN